MKKVNVYYSGWGEYWLLGQLADDGTRILFEYAPEALRQGLELSPLNLKLNSVAYGDFPLHQMRLPGLISDSLPDGWGLLLMDKIFRKRGIRIESVSPLDRLSFLGDRAMGALSFEPSSEPDLEESTYTLSEIAREVHQVVLGKTSDALPLLAIMGGSPQGARPKVLVDYDKVSGQISTDPSAAPNPWIIKFPAKEEHKEACAIEALYAKLAREAGLEICDNEYFNLGKNLSAFGMKRFDREGKLRIPTHTLAGVLHADFRLPSSVDYISLLRLTRFMTKDDREVLKAFRQCVFNVVFNNRDDHPRNYSFLLDRKRNWKFSPAYDLNYNPGPAGEHQMDICGEGKEPGRSHLLLLAEKGGLNKRFCGEIIDQILAVIPQFTREAKNLPIRAATVNKIDKAIQGNEQRLVG